MAVEEEDSSLHTLLTIMDNNHSRLIAAIRNRNSCFRGKLLSYEDAGNRLTTSSGAGGEESTEDVFLGFFGTFFYFFY